MRGDPRRSVNQRKEPTHPLVEPRLVAAVGLIALGGGLGVGLMLAHTLILLGLLLCLASAASVVWIYFRHLLRMYKSLSNKSVYSGPSVKEISVAVIMVIVIVPLAFYLYFSAERPDYLARARLQFDSAAPFKDPNSSNQWINVQMRNTGSLAGTGVLIRAEGKLTDSAAVSSEYERTEMDRLRDEIRKLPTPNNQEVQPSNTTIWTLLNVLLTDADLSNINSAKRALYVFVVANYEDEAIEGKGYWVMEFCGYFIATFSFWHTCPLEPNRIFRVDGPRQR